jgi:hypothetical protein
LSLATTGDIDRLSVWNSYLRTLAWTKGNLQDSAYVAFLRAASLKIDQQDAKCEIAQRIKQAGARPRGLDRQAVRAYAYASGGRPSNGSGSDHKTEAAWPQPVFDRISQIVAQGPLLYELWEQSPVRFPDEIPHSEEIVDAIFPLNPWLCCGWTQWDFETRRRVEWQGQLSELSFIVPSPMLCKADRTDQGRLSQHTLAATAAPVYQVVEFDFAEFEPDGQTPTIWAPHIRSWRESGHSILDACAALIWRLAKFLPLVLIVYSGGKSLHGWFNVWRLAEPQHRDFMEAAIRLGGDHHTFTRSQFVRLPDGRRENGRRQFTFFFNPANGVKNDTAILCSTC